MTNLHPVNPEFGRRSDTYDHHANAQMEAISWAKSLIPKPETPLSPILEIGAGTGNWSLALNESGYRNLLVTDSQNTPLAEAKKKFKRLNNTNQTSFQVLDAWKSNQIQNKNFNFISSANLLQWAPFYVTDNYLSFHKLLKPNGMSFHLIPIEPTLKEFYEILPDAKPFLWLSEQDWINEFEKNSMEVTFADTQDREYHFPNLLTLLRHIHATGATVRKNQPDLKKLIRANNQPISISWKSLFIISRKKVNP